LFKGKHILKQFRWLFRRFLKAVKYGFGTLVDAPVVFGNAMPKSGSHLLTQVLCGLPAIGPFVDPGFPPVNRDERNQPLDQAQILKNLRKMRPGDIRYGYIHAVEPYLSLLSRPGYAAIFLYRDPRDMIISHIFYAKDMYAGHGMHRYYNERLDTMEERINAAIEGVAEPGYELASVRQRYDSYLGWLKQPGVLSIKFEDLILHREETLSLMVDFLEMRGAEIVLPRNEAIESLNQSISPAKSGTFRKGAPGEWKVNFSEENKVVFKRVAGDLLQELGYEKSDRW
jgi:hypothetical protein